MMGYDLHPKTCILVPISSASKVLAPWVSKCLVSRQEPKPLGKFTTWNEGLTLYPSHLLSEVKSLNAQQAAQLTIT